MFFCSISAIFILKNVGSTRLNDKCPPLNACRIYQKRNKTKSCFIPFFTVLLLLVLLLSTVARHSPKNMKTKLWNRKKRMSPRQWIRWMRTDLRHECEWPSTRKRVKRAIAKNSDSWHFPNWMNAGRLSNDAVEFKCTQTQHSLIDGTKGNTIRNEAKVLHFYDHFYGYGDLISSIKNNKVWEERKKCTPPLSVATRHIVQSTNQRQNIRRQWHFTIKNTSRNERKCFRFSFLFHFSVASWKMQRTTTWQAAAKEQKEMSKWREKHIKLPLIFMTKCLSWRMVIETIP